MNCPKCGGTNNDGARFCKNCGQPLFQQQIQPPMPPSGGYGPGPWQSFLELPRNWKMLLPYLGMFIALMGFLLPWFMRENYSYSGFTVSNFAWMDIAEFNADWWIITKGQLQLMLASFWIAFACSLMGHITLWKNQIRRWVTAIAGGLGLLAMVAITIIWQTEGGKDYFYGLKAGAGFIMTWIGFAVMLAGTLVAWKDLDAPKAMPYYPPPPQNPPA